MTGTAAAVRALLVAPQWIGDAVMSQPLLARLATRGERVTVAALPWVAPVYRAMPEAAEVIEWPFAHGRLDGPARLRAAAQLRGRFDVAYVLPNSIKSALVPWLAGIPRRIGYHGEGRWLLLNGRRRNPGGRPPMVAFYAALADAGAPAADEPPAGEAARPRLQVPLDATRRACARAGVEAQRFWAFAPGAEYGPAKRWPAAHVAALARELHAMHGLPVLLLGSAKERLWCDQIADAAHGACRSLAGGTPLAEAIALIGAARGVVSNDSGLMHVAAALGVPQVAVFGSTSPEHTPPLNPRAQVIWLRDELRRRFDLHCVPCFARECRYGHLRCLTEVTPRRVADALGDALAAAPFQRDAGAGGGGRLPT